MVKLSKNVAFHDELYCVISASIFPRSTYSVQMSPIMASILHVKPYFVSATNNRSNAETKEIMKYLKFLHITYWMQYYIIQIHLWWC